MVAIVDLVDVNDFGFKSLCAYLLFIFNIAASILSSIVLPGIDPFVALRQNARGWQVVWSGPNDQVKRQPTTPTAGRGKQ